MSFSQSPSPTPRVKLNLSSKALPEGDRSPREVHGPRPAPARAKAASRRSGDPHRPLQPPQPVFWQLPPLHPSQVRLAVLLRAVMGAGCSGMPSLQETPASAPAGSRKGASQRPLASTKEHRCSASEHLQVLQGRVPRSISQTQRLRDRQVRELALAQGVWVSEFNPGASNTKTHGHEPALCSLKPLRYLDS